MEVTEKIFNQYRKVQKAGPANMANKSAIQRYAYDQEYFELVTFIEDGEYYELLMNYDKYDSKWPDETA